MNNYESPMITELGTISELTRGTGSERGYDSAYGFPWGIFGYFDSTGGSPSGSAG